MSEIADPEMYLAVELRLSAVRREDYDDVARAMRDVRDRFCRGGSGISFESVREGTVVNR